VVLLSRRRLLRLRSVVISESEQGRKGKSHTSAGRTGLQAAPRQGIRSIGLFDDNEGRGQAPAPRKRGGGHCHRQRSRLGEAMGFSAAESMTGIDIIKGRQAIGANLRATRMQRAGFSWRSGNSTIPDAY